MTLNATERFSDLLNFLRLKTVWLKELCSAQAVATIKQLPTHISCSTHTKVGVTKVLSKDEARPTFSIFKNFMSQDLKNFMPGKVLQTTAH